MDIKCKHHDKVITHLCLNCGEGYVPVCGKCITEKHQYHKYIEIEEVDSDLQIEIDLKYHKVLLSQVNDKLKMNKLSLNNLNEKFNEIQDNHQLNKIEISKQFKILIQRLQVIELELKKQLENIFKETQQMNIEKISKLKFIQTLYNIIEKLKENNSSNHKDSNSILEYIEMVNHIYKFNIFFKSYNSCLDDLDFIYPKILKNQKSIDTYDETIQSLLSIKKQIPLKKNYDIEFISNKDGKIPEGTKHYALISGHPLPSDIPSRLIPDSVKELYFGDIDQAPSSDSIPSTVTNLTFCNGYKHKIIKGFIPDSAKSLYFCDIDQAPSIDSIPSSVKYLTFENGFKHKIIEGLIPKSVFYLSINKIDQPLSIDSIPPSVKTLEFSNGYKENIIKGLIPSSVTHLIFGNVLHLPDKDSNNNSIPREIWEFTFTDKFNHKINGLINHPFSNVNIGDIVEPLDTNSLPRSSVIKLKFNDGFKYKVAKETIPESVRTQIIGDIVKEIDKNSLSNSVNLTFGGGYKHKIRKETIPGSVSKLNIDHIEESLDKNSIPNWPSLTDLSFASSWGTTYNHQINKDIIPPCIKYLYFGNIKFQPDIGSIPITVQKVTTTKSFNHSLEGIIPKGTSLVKL